MSTDQKPGLVVGRSGTDQVFRLNPEPFPGVLMDGDRRRCNSSRSVAAAVAGQLEMLLGTGCVWLCWTEDDGVQELFGFMDLVEYGCPTFQLYNFIGQADAAVTVG